jgi:hypothetical protein
MEQKILQTSKGNTVFVDDFRCWACGKDTENSSHIIFRGRAHWIIVCNETCMKRLGCVDITKYYKELR